MYEIQVEKMTCGGCASRVTRALLAVDDAAKVNVDLRNRTVHVESEFEVEELTRAISAAGYPASVRTVHGEN